MIFLKTLEKRHSLKYVSFFQSNYLRHRIRHYSIEIFALKIIKLRSAITTSCFFSKKVLLVAWCDELVEKAEYVG